MPYIGYIDKLTLYTILDDNTMEVYYSMQEEWLPIVGYEGLYEVSNLGRIRSLKCSKGRRKKPRILLSHLNKQGYLHTLLSKDSVRKWFFVHRLVAQAFLPNPHNYQCINHKDEVKTNNSVENLEWCTYQYNNTYGNGHIKRHISKQKAVICVETGTVYESVKKASKETGANCKSISQVLNGGHSRAGGYHWQYC